MIKRIIFDIDDTILESSEVMKKSFELFALNYPEYNKDIKKIYEEIDVFCVNNEITKEGIINYIKNNINSNFNEYYFDEAFKFVLDNVECMFEKTTEILKYLSNKYEIYALSNWLYDHQYKRLNKLGIDKYFNKIYCADNFGKKPDKNTYLNICKPYNVSECLIIGDNIILDVKMPLELGMNAIFLNLKDKKTNYKNIKNINELKEIL